MNEKKIAVFPGSFDPVTVGHEGLIRRALPLFDKIVVGIGVNSEKQAWFSVEERMELLRMLFAKDDKIEVAAYTGLTADFCREQNARYILRGLRTAIDFEYEKTIAAVNKEIYPDVESVFLCAEVDLSFVQSSIVRDFIRHGKPVDGMVPPVIAERIRQMVEAKR